MPTSDRPPLRTLLVFLALSLAAALPGSLFPPGDWYRSLDKPAWTPPSWLFGPVWTVLYLMIGVSGSLLWHHGRQSRAFFLWCVQLAANAAWSGIFFGLHAMGTAAIEIVLLWLLILATIMTGLRVHRLAAWLLVPYLLWVGYAASLNLALWSLNR